SGKRLDVTALAFGVQGIESQRRLARARQAGNHDQPVAWQIEVDVFQSLRAGTADADEIHSLDDFLVNLLIYWTSKAFPNPPVFRFSTAVCAPFQNVCIRPHDTQGVARELWSRRHFWAAHARHVHYPAG